MSRSLEPAFFPMVLDALQLRGAESVRIWELTDAQWEELLTFCDLAHLTLPLVKACRDDVPAWVLSRTKQNLADNRLRVHRIETAYREIAEAFERAGVEHLVFKGFAQYPDFAEALDFRMQSDIDLYCPPEALPAAQAALESLGYEANQTLGKFPADHLPEMTRKGAWHWQGNAYDPEMPPAIDVHFCFWNPATTRLSIPGVNKFWGRRIHRRRADLSFPALCPIDSLAFNALHVLRDLQRGDWVIHHVYELAWFLDTHAGDEMFWQDWLARHDDSLRSLQAISFWLAREWFHCRCASAVEREMTILPRPVARWLERFSRSPLTGMFLPNKHGVWLHLALLQSRWDRLPILGSALLPVRLPAVGAPGQDATKSRRTRKFWPSQRYARYIFHVIFRIAFHLQTLPNTMWHGLCWWLDQRRLSAPRT
jgi:putative nucleotidyltransferase-like protein